MADGSVMIAMIGATKGSFGSVGSTCSTSCGAAPTQEHSSDACPSSGKAMAGGLLSASTPFLARKNEPGRKAAIAPDRALYLVQSICTQSRFHQNCAHTFPRSTASLPAILD